MPQWLEDDYFHRIRELAAIGAKEVLQAETAEDVRTILSIIAIAKCLRMHGELLVKRADDELGELVSNR